eukprot:g17053.t1
MLREINPTARLLESRFAEVPLGEILGLQAFDKDRLAASVLGLPVLEEREEGGHGHAHSHSDGHCNDCEAGHPRAGSGHFSYGRLESFLVLMESRVFFCKERLVHSTIPTRCRVAHEQAARAIKKLETLDDPSLLQRHPFRFVPMMRKMFRLFPPLAVTLNAAQALALQRTVSDLSCVRL